MTFLEFFAESSKVATSTVKNIPPDSAIVILGRALNIAYFISGVIAVIVIILAGYTFSTSVYDPAKVTQAKNSLIYSIVGLIVIIMAWAITQFIMGKF